MIKPLSILLFIVSLSLGVYYINYMAPPRRKIFVFPTPENVDDLQYTDLSQTCFKYDTKKVQCPKDPSKISNYVVQGQ